jgi:hypothetical protein
MGDSSSTFLGLTISPTSRLQTVDDQRLMLVSYIGVAHKRTIQRLESKNSYKKAEVENSQGCRDKIVIRPTRLLSKVCGGKGSN